MQFCTLFQLELWKAKGSGLAPLLLAAPVLTVVSGIANIGRYFTPETTGAWSAMYIQSALLYAYYLLPVTEAVLCVLLLGRETENRGLVRLLTLPLGRGALSMAKLCALVLAVFLEVLTFFLVFLLAGLAGVRFGGIREAVPLPYLMKSCAGLFAASLPGAAVLWAVTACIGRPLAAAGLELLLILPGVLAAATPLWPLWPTCYAGFLVSHALHDFTAAGPAGAFPLKTFLAWAVPVTLAAIALAAGRFGKRTR